MNGDGIGRRLSAGCRAVAVHSNLAWGRPVTRGAQFANGAGGVLRKHNGVLLLKIAWRPPSGAAARLTLQCFMKLARFYLKRKNRLSIRMMAGLFMSPFVQPDKLRMSWIYCFHVLAISLLHSSVM